MREPTRVVWRAELGAHTSQCPSKRRGRLCKFIQGHWAYRHEDELGITWPVAKAEFISAMVKPGASNEIHR